MDEQIEEEAKRVVKAIEKMAEKHWEARERKWWERADELKKYMPKLRLEIIRCCREAFMDGYTTRVLEEQNSHAVKVD